jgi:hypothetical protein
MGNSDFGTPETQRRGIEVGYNSDGDRVARVSSQNRLDTLWSRGLVDDDQYYAGRQLQQDHRAAGLAVVIRSSADFSVTGVIASAQEVYLDAIKRFTDATDTLTKAEKAIVRWIVLDDGYLKDLKQSVDEDDDKRQDPQFMHLGYNLLRDALDKIAKEYGL